MHGINRLPKDDISKRLSNGRICVSPVFYLQSKSKAMENNVAAEPTVENLIEALKKHVGIRNQMGGAMWWNVINDECCQKANEIVRRDPSRRKELLDIVGHENMQ